jgi:hypothetical protein
VVRAGPARVELRQGDGTITIEAEDVTIASLARLRGSLGAPERRGPGDPLPARERPRGRRRAGRLRRARARYWNYVGSRDGARAEAAPRELEARRRFYEAEREFEKADRWRRRS